MHFVAILAAIGPQCEKNRQYPIAGPRFPMDSSVTERTLPIVMGRESQIVQQKQFSSAHVALLCSHFYLLAEGCSPRRKRPYRNPKRGLET